MSSLKYARRLIYMACFPLCVLSIIAICLLIVLAITGEWLDITPQLSFLMTVLTAGVVLIAALTLYTQQKQGNEMIKSLREELKYLTGKLYEEPKLKILFWVPPKHLKRIDYAPQKDDEYTLDKLELKANRDYDDIMIRMEAEEKQSICMIEVGFQGKIDKKPEVLDVALGFVKKQIREPQRIIYTTIWDYLNVAYITPTRVPKDEKIFCGIKVKTKEPDEYKLEIRVTVDEAEKQLTRLLLVEVK